MCEDIIYTQRYIIKNPHMIYSYIYQIFVYIYVYLKLIKIEKYLGLSWHSVQLWKNTDQKEIRIWTIFTQWIATAVSIYLFKVNNRNTRNWCEICSKVIIKTPERRHWLWWDKIWWVYGLWTIFLKRYHAWKVSVFGVFLVYIFPHSDWIPKDTEFSRSVHSFIVTKYFLYFY